MISEDALNALCRPAILGRAQIIARREGRLWKRRLSYEGSLTKLEAYVDSATGYEDHYHARICFDEAADEVVSYSCTCPAAARYPGPCKHSVALALDFNRDPARYEGFDRLQHVSTSSVLGEYLDKLAAPARPHSMAHVEEPAGAVRLDLSLLHERDLFARFSVAGAHGAYAMRSISDFVSRLGTGDWFEYGKKLAFTHEMGAFDDASAQVARFLVRCVQNRRAFAAEKVHGRVYGSAGSAQATLGRELRLSGPEADELLGLYLGRTVEFEGAGRVRREAGARHLVVRDGDPEARLLIEAAPDSAFELRRETGLDFFSTGERLYALDGRALWRCTPRLEAVSGFLTGVWASPSTQLLLAEKDVPRFASSVLPRLERALEVEVPRELEALRPEPLRLEFVLDSTSQGVSCDLLALYGEEVHHLLDRGEQLGAGPGRKLEEEAEARRLVARYFPLPRVGAEPAGVALIPRGDDDATAQLVFGGVSELARMGKVLASDSFLKLASHARPRLHMGLSLHANLIDLEVSAEDLPLDELYALLSSYREQKRFHRLRDGSFVDLSQLDLREAASLAEELGLSARQLSAGHAEIPAYKAFLLDSLAQQADRDASFEKYLDDFRSIDPASFEAPASISDRLRPYQLAGYQWLRALVEMDLGGILADEMGLGKSIQLISLLLSQRGRGSTLVVCPASLVYNWLEEFGKFAPQIDVVAVAGSAPERERLRAEAHEVYISSYDLVRRDVREWARKPLWCEVLDEAQYIKNHETLSARAVKALDARHRLALTGTPIENRLSELWSIFDFLMPGLLGTHERFRERYEQPALEGDDEAVTSLGSAVGPFILRRLKSQVLKDLPEKMEQVVYARMDGEQRTLYAAHEQALRLSLTSQTESTFDQGKLQVLAELTKLRQICCDPRLLYADYDGESCKLETIMELIASVVDSQKKMLVFSQFTSYLSLIRKRLDEQGVAHYTITGATPKRQRVDLVNAFNSDETPVFLISLKAGGTGLNLVGAQVVIHADPWWNAAAQNQATDRAHRIGQTRDVTVYKVIAKDSIEDRILALQEIKSSLASQVVEAGGCLSLASLRKEDLIDLLG